MDRGLRSGCPRSMVGTRAKPRLKTKGAETWGVCLFVCATCGKGGWLGDAGPAWRAAGLALERVVALMRDAPPVVPAHQLQEMLEAYLRHLALARRLGYHLLPKHHLMFHLLARAAVQGNPRLYGTWLDESLNHELKLCLRNVHQCAFESLGLAKMQVWLDMPAGPQKRRRRPTAEL